MTEYPQHKRAKDRIKIILESNGWTVKLEKEMPQITSIGERNYIADVYAFKVVQSIQNNQLTIGAQQIIVEVDGKRGHHGTIARRKNDLRDQTFKAKGITTVRFPTGWIVGKKAVTDDDIMKQINWSLTC